MRWIDRVPPILAHQGGWDEFLLVSIPVVLLVLLLVRANQAATRISENARLQSLNDTPPDEDARSVEDAGPQPSSDE